MASPGGRQMPAAGRRRGDLLRPGRPPGRGGHPDHVVAGQGVVGGWVSVCGSCVVVRSSTRTGGRRSRRAARPRPSSTGRRPARSMPLSTLHGRAGWPMDPGRRDPAHPADHLSELRRDTPVHDDDGSRGPDRPAQPGDGADLAPAGPLQGQAVGGGRSAAAGRVRQPEAERGRRGGHEQRSDAERGHDGGRPGPRPALARGPRSHAAAQTAQMISPGRTSGTRRRLAHGWSGTIWAARGRRPSRRR